jgi:hypothetical protein
MPSRLSLLALACLLSACATEAGQSASASAKGGLVASETKDPAQIVVKELGTQCKIDTECATNTCVAGLCTKVCTATADCAANQDCNSDDGTRLICLPRAYPEHAGLSCSLSECDGALICLSTPESSLAVCSASCQSSLDCPPDEICRQGKDSSQCVPRRDGAPCVTDSQCGTGGICALLGDAGYCTTACTKAKGTECPPFAACTGLDDGRMACVHKKGTFSAEGNFCDPCNGYDKAPCGGVGSDGKVLGACLTLGATGERFCSVPCDAGGKCATGATCQKIGGLAVSQCVPTKNTCVKLAVPMSKKGDILPDFSMAGWYDENANFDLKDESTQVLRLSDFASTGRFGDRGYKKILFTVSAIWCPYCKQETSQFKKMLTTSTKYKDLLIFQVLYEGPNPGDAILLDDTFKKWIKPLNAQGAVGTDPDHIVGTWMGLDSGPPLNILINAETRQILSRINGSPQDGMDSWLDPLL